MSQIERTIEELKEEQAAAAELQARQAAEDAAARNPSNIRKQHRELLLPPWVDLKDLSAKLELRQHLERINKTQLHGTGTIFEDQEDLPMEFCFDSLERVDLRDPPGTYDAGGGFRYVNIHRDDFGWRRGLRLSWQNSREQASQLTIDILNRAGRTGTSLSDTVHDLSVTVKGKDWSSVSISPNIDESAAQKIEGKIGEAFLEPEIVYREEKPAPNLLRRIFRKS
ncbi:hypothetical protein A2870_03560 [Candidatus Curtissbacteria bacterium RIFCSPHIGHO2_01_FULL_41_11]|uniref:Uncharacterized protein n=1 Tax=Candidatus Curtissbacteria bacterium RIFCSPHIGHO2_01_FULL_41_11 TaxID=1797711 RepID=A0A1F5G5T5_9BACT|nr:MAG: hypothetical protein A2870_03560 [Candidatus Curtissbacteria bacterium RIFCSPHIGHO2_01_FULL_41_11]